MIVLRRLHKGRVCEVWALGDDRRCPLLDALQALQVESPREWTKAVVLLERTAEHGPPRNNEQRSRALGDGLFELKPGRLRIVFFWEPGRLLICTHSFVKKCQKTPAGEIRLAKRARRDFLMAKAHGFVRRQIEGVPDEAPEA